MDEDISWGDGDAPPRIHSGVGGIAIDVGPAGLIADRLGRFVSLMVPQVVPAGGTNGDSVMSTSSSGWYWLA